VDGGGSDNLVKIQHDDGTIAAYSHIHDAMVAVGEGIEAGDPTGAGIRAKRAEHPLCIFRFRRVPSL
jgi:hypothetical protein